MKFLAIRTVDMSSSPNKKDNRPVGEETIIEGDSLAEAISAAGMDETHYDFRSIPEDFSHEEYEWDGTAYVSNLSPLIRRLHLQIDAAAGSLRNAYVTDIPGQEETYRRKVAEAEAWAAAETPVETDYPYIHMEGIETGWGFVAVANDVLTTAAQWNSLNNVIESKRRGYKVRIEEAADAATMKSLHAEVIAAFAAMMPGETP